MSVGRNNMAGPVLRGGETTMAIVDAIVEDNPEKDVKIADHGAYIRVEAEGGVILRRQTVETMLGRPFRMQEIEVYLTGFSGKIETTQESVRWYFNHLEPVA